MDNKEALKQQYLITKGQPYILDIDGKKYKIKQICNKVRTKIHILTMEAQLLTEQSKQAMSIRKAKKIHKRIYALHAKTAAYYLLNRKALLIPFAFAIKWRKLYLLDDEDLRKINTIGASNEGFAAFLLGWQLSKSLLEVSTNLLGSVLEQKNERKVSAKNMVVEDSQIKADNK